MWIQNACKDHLQRKMYWHPQTTGDEWRGEDHIGELLPWQEMCTLLSSCVQTCGCSRLKLQAAWINVLAVLVGLKRAVQCRLHIISVLARDTMTSLALVLLLIVTIVVPSASAQGKGNRNYFCICIFLVFVLFKVHVFFELLWDYADRDLCLLSKVGLETVVAQFQKLKSAGPYWRVTMCSSHHHAVYTQWCKSARAFSECGMWNVIKLRLIVVDSEIHRIIISHKCYCFRISNVHK